VEGVYIIHFLEPLKHAYHYIGWSNDIDGRMKKHREGDGARIVSAVNDAGIKWIISRIYEGKDRQFEKKLKSQKSAKGLCPICRPEYLKRSAETMRRLRKKWKLERKELDHGTEKEA
jgi:predicted GIY-YIG superfamily endonuclease